MGKPDKTMKSFKCSVLFLALFISFTFGDDSGSASVSSSEESMMSGEGSSSEEMRKNNMKAKKGKKNKEDNSTEEEMSEESSSMSMEEEMSEESSSMSMEEEMSEENTSGSTEEEMSEEEEEEETERRQKKTALKMPKCKKMGMTPTEVEELDTIDNVKNFIKCLRKCNKNEDCEAWRFCKETKTCNLFSGFKSFEENEKYISGSKEDCLKSKPTTTS